MFSKSFLTVAAALWSSTRTSAQTFSSCNPLYSTSCPADPALGSSINIDFTKGAADSFTATGNPTYDSNGVSFTVAKSGDSPTLTSKFYIMFGKVSLTMKAAPGAGIVSTLVLQSDDLDEIDLEWLGADGTEVQTNYFGKGDVTTYNRGQFNPAPNNQDQFITYTIEWTESQVTWSVGNTIVRVLTPETADANQYPQTPMQIKFGAWSGGDPSNQQGTIEWARGPTDYSQGPFTMVAQSLSVTDYSTGTQYTYGDTSGSWGSIQAAGGKVNGNSGGAAGTVATADVPAATSASPSIPAGVGGTSNTDTVTRTGWPWVANPTTMQTVTNTYTSQGNAPSGWVVTASGKVQPSAAVLPASTSISLPAQSPSPSSQPLPGAGLETVTGWDDRGFLTTKVLPAGWQSTPKSFDEQGFLVTPTPATAVPVVATGSLTAAGGVFQGQSPADKVIGTKTSEAAGPKETNPSWRSVAILGLAVAVAERVLL